MKTMKDVSLVESAFVLLIWAINSFVRGVSNCGEYQHGVTSIRRRGSILNRVLTVYFLFLESGLSWPYLGI